MARPRLFYLEPILSTRGGPRNEKYVKISKQGALVVCSNIVKEAKGDSQTQTLCITLLGDSSNRTVGFKLSDKFEIPLNKNQKILKIRDTGIVVVSIKGFLRQSKTAIHLPTGRLEVKDYLDDVYGKVYVSNY